MSYIKSSFYYQPRSQGFSLQWKSLGNEVVILPLYCARVTDDLGHQFNLTKSLLVHILGNRFKHFIPYPTSYGIDGSHKYTDIRIKSALIA